MDFPAPAVVQHPVVLAGAAVVPAGERFITSLPLDAMVAEAVEQPPDAAPPPLIDRADEPSGAMLTEAVIAAHDARIAILRQRIGMLGPGGTPAALIADLNRRLQRAQAARSLAARRLVTDVVVDASGRDDRPPTALAAPVKAVRHGVGRATMASAWPAAFMPALRGAASLARAPGHPMSSIAHRALPTPVVLAMRHDYRHHATAMRLAHARHGLATARRLLQDAAPPAPATAPTGLWRWQGSDTWSLAAGDAV